MSELDLSKAVEAASTEAIENDLWPGHDDEMELIVRAALPHTLEALAGWFETEDPESLNGGDREFQCVAVYLRALKERFVAESVNHGHLAS